MNGLSQLNHAGLLGAVGSTSPPRGGLVLPMETWGPPRHLEVALFSLEDEENIVPIAEDDDVHLLDVDDIEAVMADANEGNGLHVEDDVWNAAVARLGSGNTQPVWGYVGPQTENPVLNYTAYEPPTRMYDVDYTAMRDREHEARVFGCSSSSNYGELEPR
ncbi:hypothetical protein V6N11_029257 [Hibiscus sabdariffa]|uniref:Uncharacterized protein n=1 Tax=Hibiscus sabdariffa TaxID=183260 RepID=A0ABR2A847_9ROSI